MIVIIGIVIAVLLNKKDDNLTANEILTAMKQNEELEGRIYSDIEITNVSKCWEKIIVILQKLNLWIHLTRL